MLAGAVSAPRQHGIATMPANIVASIIGTIGLIMSDAESAITAGKG
jgi:hypothetical protein